MDLYCLLHHLRSVKEKNMKIGVLGAGMMTEALAGRWVQAGHDVLIGGRNAAKTAELAKRIGARAGTLREAAEDGEVILLAVLREGPGTALKDGGARGGTRAGEGGSDVGAGRDRPDF